MNRSDLVAALSGRVDATLCGELVDEFLELRLDVATGTLGRSSAGKFVESLVQVLQYLESGRYDAKPKVDDFLTGLESRSVPIDDGLRICASRVARAMYTLRNKRNIAHKNDVDANAYDARFQLHAAQWVMAEFLRNVSGLSMKDTGALVDLVQAPVGGLSDDFAGRRIVVRDGLSTREEALVFLHGYYPTPVKPALIVSAMDRHRSATVHSTLRRLWTDRLVHRDAKLGYKLTAPTGTNAALAVINLYIQN